VTWTRLTIVGAVGGADGEALPDLGPTLQRVQDNQDDIGSAVGLFFGQAAGDQLAALLHEHISVAVELVSAAKAGDAAGVVDAKERWYANGEEIADFLASANPRFWPQQTMRAAMQMHLDQTLDEAVHRLQGEYSAEIDDYEQAHLHILAMADLLSSGIIRGFRRCSPDICRRLVRRAKSLRPMLSLLIHTRPFRARHRDVSGDRSVAGAEGPVPTDLVTERRWGISEIGDVWRHVRPVHGELSRQCHRPCSAGVPVRCGS
jgi:hypothetical protein